MKLGSLSKNIAMMGLGTVLAQLINILVQPILSRIIPADDLGVYTYILSIANVVIPIASLKLELLIVSEQDEQKAQYITDVCILSCVLVSVLMLSVLLIVKLTIEDLPLFNYGNIVFVGPVIVLFNGLRFVFISYNNRYKQYKLISMLGVLREFARAVIQLLSGLLSLGPIGLLIGYAAAPVFGFRIQMKSYFEGIRSRPMITLPVIRSVIHDGRKQMLFITPAQLLNSFSASLITIMIGSLYASSTLGYYSMGVRVLEVPIIFIAANVSKVCFQAICERKSKNEKVTPVVISVALPIAACSIVFFSMLFFFAERFCALLFGDGYEIAGVYIKCLCLMYATRLVATSFAGTFTAFNRQGYELFLNSLLVIGASVVFLISKYNSFDIILFLTLIGSLYTCVYLLMFFGMLVSCVMHDRSIS